MVAQTGGQTEDGLVKRNEMGCIPQDIHISCSRKHIKALVREWQRQFEVEPLIDVYDWGWSRKFRQGYIVLCWKMPIPSSFVAQLNSDTRVEGYTIYNLCENQCEPLICNNSSIVSRP